MSRGFGAAPLAALLAAGCVSGSYDHASLDEPVAEADLAALRPGVDDLRSCLAALGAPHRVFEYRVAADRTSGAALLWIWRDERGFGVEVSSGRDEVPGSFSFDWGATDLPGCMLWFGPDLVLERWQRGLVGDLAPRRRPAGPVDG